MKEIRAFIRKHLTSMFSEQSDVEVDVEDDIFVDDFMNVIEVAAAVKS